HPADPGGTPGPWGRGGGAEPGPGRAEEATALAWLEVPTSEPCLAVANDAHPHGLQLRLGDAGAIEPAAGAQPARGTEQPRQRTAEMLDLAGAEQRADHGDGDQHRGKRTERAPHSGIGPPPAEARGGASGGAEAIGQSGLIGD